MPNHPRDDSSAATRERLRKRRLALFNSLTPEQRGQTAIRNTGPSAASPQQVATLPATPTPAAQSPQQLISIEDAQKQQKFFGRRDRGNTGLVNRAAREGADPRLLAAYLSAQPQIGGRISQTPQGKLLLRDLRKAAGSRDLGGNAAARQLTEDAESGRFSATEVDDKLRIAAKLVEQNASKQLRNPTQLPATFDPNAFKREVSEIERLQAGVRGRLATQQRAADRRSSLQAEGVTTEQGLERQRGRETRASEERQNRLMAEVKRLAETESARGLIGQGSGAAQINADASVEDRRVAGVQGLAEIKAQGQETRDTIRVQSEADQALVNGANAATSSGFAGIDATGRPIPNPENPGSAQSVAENAPIFNLAEGAADALIGSINPFNFNDTGGVDARDQITSLARQLESTQNADPKGFESEIKPFILSIWAKRVKDSQTFTNSDLNRLYLQMQEAIQNNDWAGLTDLAQQTKLNSNVFTPNTLERF